MKNQLYTKVIFNEDEGICMWCLNSTKNKFIVVSKSHRTPMHLGCYQALFKLIEPEQLKHMKKKHKEEFALEAL